MIRIRACQDKDREQVISLWKTCKLTRPWNDPNKDIDPKTGVGNELFIILEVGNQLIGTLMGGYDGHRGVMNYLAVHPKLQGRGYGKIAPKKEALSLRLTFHDNGYGLGRIKNR